MILPDRCCAGLDHSQTAGLEGFHNIKGNFHEHLWHSSGGKMTSSENCVGDAEEVTKTGCCRLSFYSHIYTASTSDNMLSHHHNTSASSSSTFIFTVWSAASRTSLLLTLWFLHREEKTSTCTTQNQKDEESQSPALLDKWKSQVTARKTEWLSMKMSITPNSYVICVLH